MDDFVTKNTPKKASQAKKKVLDENKQKEVSCILDKNYHKLLTNFVLQGGKRKSDDFLDSDDDLLGDLGTNKKKKKKADTKV